MRLCGRLEMRLSSRIVGEAFRDVLHEQTTESHEPDMCCHASGHGMRRLAHSKRIFGEVKVARLSWVWSLIRLALRYHLRLSPI